MSDFGLVALHFESNFNPRDQEKGQPFLGLVD